MIIANGKRIGRLFLLFSLAVDGWLDVLPGWLCVLAYVALMASLTLRLCQRRESLEGRHQMRCVSG